MAFNGTLTLAPGIWTLLTSSDVPKARVQNKSGYTLQLQATVGAVAPTNGDGSIDLATGQTLAEDTPFAVLWGGVVGANRLYGMLELGGKVSVSHA